MNPVVELEIPARLELVALARLVVSSFASSSAGMAGDRVDDLKIAVSEACTNAIEAHDAAATDERVVVRCREADEGVEVLIEDRGSGFDPTTIPTHPPITDPDRLNFERGLGITLIRALVDEVEFQSSDEGTSVRILMQHSPDDVD